MRGEYYLTTSSISHSRERQAWVRVSSGAGTMWTSIHSRPWTNEKRVFRLHDLYWPIRGEYCTWTCSWNWGSLIIPLSYLSVRYRRASKYFTTLSLYLTNMCWLEAFLNIHGCVLNVSTSFLKEKDNPFTINKNPNLPLVWSDLIHREVFHFLPVVVDPVYRDIFTAEVDKCHLYWVRVPPQVALVQGVSGDQLFQSLHRKTWH